MPRAVASFSWDIPSVLRRSRRRLPTWTSVGCGSLLVTIMAPSPLRLHETAAPNGWRWFETAGSTIARLQARGAGDDRQPGHQQRREGARVQHGQTKRL